MILIIDNYDSFVYDIVHRISPDIRVTVKRNDEIDLSDVTAFDPDGIIVSPGPGRPEEAGISLPIFRELSYPTFGICLGHQALCRANDVPVEQSDDIKHGESSKVVHTGDSVFHGLPSPLDAGRYHSLVAESDDLSDVLRKIAWLQDSEMVMGVAHREKPHVGVQIHPESILTKRGRAIIRNFCERYCGI